MPSSSGVKSLGDVSICVAIDKSGSTYGETLRAEIGAVQRICSLVSPRNKNPVRLLPWCDVALPPLSLPDSSRSMYQLQAGGGTNPSVLYSSTASLQAVSACGLWFLLTDGQIEDSLVQEFALATTRLGLHGLACIIVIFGSVVSGPPVNCDISVGIATYAAVPDCMFVFHDIRTGGLSVMQAKGCFKELLPNSEHSYIQPLINEFTTWAELPHISYKDLARIRIAPPRELGADELALQDNLVIRMQDLYSGAIDAKSVGEIVRNEDNLKSIVMAEMTRGSGKDLQAWLDEQQKPEPELTRDRPDIDGCAQRTVTQLVTYMKKQGHYEAIEDLRSILREAHAQNWSHFRLSLHDQLEEKKAVRSSNRAFRRAHRYSDANSPKADRTADPTRRNRGSNGRSFSGRSLCYVDIQDGGDPEQRQGVICLENVLFFPGFERRSSSDAHAFLGNCMLCCNISVLTILLKTPPDISTPNFPRRGSYSPLVFPLAMSRFAETDIVSLFLCCDSCALYLVRNFVSPLGESIAGALPLASIDTNQTAWVETLDLAFKGRFRKSDLLALFVAVLDRKFIENRNRITASGDLAHLEDAVIFGDALKRAKQSLLDIAEVPFTLNPSTGYGGRLQSRSANLHTVISHRPSFDHANAKNVDIRMLRYPVPGFMVIIRLMHDQRTGQEQIQTHLFQRLVYHCTEVYLTLLDSMDAIYSINKHLGRNPRNSMPPVQPSTRRDVRPIVSIEELLELNLLDQETLSMFREVEEFEDIEKQARPATAIYLHNLSAHARNFSSPVDCFNALKAKPSVIKAIVKPLSVNEGLSKDLILQIENEHGEISGNGL